MLSMQTRLECPHSYATEENPDLQCEICGLCDGTLYDCCLWNLDYGEQMLLITESERWRKQNDTSADD